MYLRCRGSSLFLRRPTSINNPRGLSAMGSPLLILVWFHHLFRFWRRNAVRILQGRQLEGEEQRWLRLLLVGAFSSFWRRLWFLLCRQLRQRHLYRRQHQYWRRFRLLRLTSPPCRICFDAEYKFLHGVVVKRLRHRPFTAVTMGSIPSDLTILWESGRAVNYSRL